MNIIPNIVKSKRHLCASGSILLPLAQKWGLVGVAVAALSAFATQSVSAASLTVEIPTNPLTVNVSASGGFSEASGKVSVKGDAYWGYDLSIQAKNGDNALTSKEGNTISSITEAKSKAQFPDNAWGYKFGKDNADTSNDNFQPGPTTKVMLDTTESSGNHDYTFTIGAKVNAIQPAGNYFNTFTVTATAKTVSYNITYDCRGGNGCSTQSGASTEQSLKLNQPTRDGYRFLGYCTSCNTAALNEKRCAEKAGTTYHPSDTYTLNKAGNTATLYAMWEPTTMQSFGEYCSAMDIETDALTLKDTRDNKEYTVAKLKDGKCWMTQNLAIGSDKEMTLMPSDTNVTDNYTLPASSTIGFNNSEAQHIYVDPEMGGFYNWMAATAGSGVPSGGDAPQSICPKGWHLPKGGTNNEFQALFIKYNSVAEMMDSDNGPRFNLFGYYHNSTKVGANTGWYWSSTAANNIITRLSLNAGSINPVYGDTNIVVGDQVRCVADELIMQDVAIWGDNIKEGETIAVFDERDGNSYRVRRLADGKLWMVDNLRLGDSKLTNRTLTADNTDLTGITTYSLPDSSKNGFNNNAAQNVYVVELDNGDELKNYGGYYTWCAATAGTCSNITSAEQVASSSICPRGWRLPTNSEHQALNIAIGSDVDGDLDSKLTDSNGPAFTRAGYYVNNASASQGSYGYYWSSTASSSSNAYDFEFSAFRVNPAENGGGWYDGNSVRCVAKCSSCL